MGAIGAALSALAVLVGATSAVSAGGGPPSPTTAAVPAFEISGPERATAPVAPEQKPKPRPKGKPKPKPQVKPLLRGTAVIRWGNTLPAGAPGYERFSYVLVSRGDARKAARLPGRSLVYMSGTSIPRGWSTGVPYAQAAANGWLLTASNGAPIMNVQYDAYVGDFGLPAYQKQFVDNVASFLKATKLDGVFIDDVIGDPAVLTDDAYPAKYANAEAWENAMVSFVTYVGRALKARGYYVLVNAVKFVKGDTRSDTGEFARQFWSRIAPSVSGLMSEYWLQNPIDNSQMRSIGSRWQENWTGWQSLVSAAQAAGADFFGLMYGPHTDTRAMRFGRGSFLLDWDGNGGAFLYQINTSPDPYHAAWVTQYGRPVGGKFERAPGVWQRRYEKGIIVLNATTASVTVRVHGRLQTVGPTDALFSRTPRS